MLKTVLIALIRLARGVTCFALLSVAACSTTNTASTRPPSQDGQNTNGGPPWVFPPGAGSDDVASIPPDIAIPLEGLAGTWTGGRLGSKLDKDARQKMIDLTQLTLSQTPPGEKVSWKDGTIAGTVTPQVRFLGPGNLSCREFHQVLRADGQVETGYATACQAPDGSWRLLAE